MKGIHNRIERMNETIAGQRLRQRNGTEKAKQKKRQEKKNLDDRSQTVGVGKSQHDRYKGQLLNNEQT